MSVRQTKTGRECARGRFRTARAMAFLFVVSAGAISAPPAISMPRAGTDTLPDPRDPFYDAISEATTRFGIPAAWIRAVIRVESGGDPRAVSPVGAMGLMQVMPSTWAALTARHGLGRDPFDTRANILAGTAYLREMLDRYGNVAAMLAAYNAGLGRYDEYLSTGRPLPAETRAYVAKLAPILGGEALPGGASTTPSPPTDWREAPLFVAPALGGSPAGSPQPGGQSDADPTHDDDATSFPAAGIFVARSEGNSSP